MQSINNKNGMIWPKFWITIGTQSLTHKLTILYRSTISGGASPPEIFVDALSLNIDIFCPVFFCFKRACVQYDQFVFVLAEASHFALLPIPVHAVQICRVRICKLLGPLFFVPVHFNFSGYLTLCMLAACSFRRVDNLHQLNIAELLGTIIATHATDNNRGNSNRNKRQQQQQQRNPAELILDMWRCSALFKIDSTDTPQSPAMNVLCFQRLDLIMWVHCWQIYGHKSAV